MRTPDELDGVSWLNYLKDAVEREAGIQWTPPGYMVGVWVKQLMKLRDEGVNPYQLALALDLVALRWERYCLKSPWELLTPGMLFYAFRSLVRPELFWRSVWFSRFAETGDEVKYLAYWLTQFEAALAADPGTRGKSALQQTAEQRLKVVEEKTRLQDKPPTFHYHWLKGWMDDARRT